MKKSNTSVVLGVALICLGVFGFGCGAEEIALPSEVGKADFQDKITLSKDGQSEIVRIVECKTKPTCDIVVKVDQLYIETESHPYNKVGLYFTLKNIDGEKQQFLEPQSKATASIDVSMHYNSLQLLRTLEKPVEIPFNGLPPGRYFATFSLHHDAEKASFSATARTSCVKTWWDQDINNTLGSATPIGAIELEQTTIGMDQLSLLKTGSIHTWDDVDFYSVNLNEHRTGTIEVKLLEPDGADLMIKAWALCNSGGDEFTCSNTDNRFFSHEEDVHLGPQNCTIAPGSNTMTMDLDCAGDEGAVIYLAVELAKQEDILFPSLGDECHDEDMDNTYSFLVTRIEN